MKMRHIAQILGVLALFAAGAWADAARSPARALGILACTFNVPTVAFGSVDVLSGGAGSTSTTMTINCSGISILPTTVYVCVALPARAMTGPSSATLNYDLYGPAPLNASWSNTAQIAVPITGSLLGFSGSRTVAIPATLFANQPSAPPGVYSQTLNAIATYDTASCTAGLFGNSTAFSFQATATVVKSCNVSATNLNFGTAGFLNAAITGQSAITVQCSNGTGYAIELNGGLAGAANPTQRKMTFGANAVTYGLYQDVNHVNPWGSAIGGNVVNGTGTSIGQSIPVYGLVPIQPTPPPGTYSDTIVVSVAY
jgi:spore coat protein U-like protein